MISFCGRTICNVSTPNGKEKISFFNSALEEPSTVTYYDNEGNKKYIMTLTGNEKSKGYRCMNYTRFSLGNQLENFPRVVPFADLSLKSDGKETAQAVSPLYEVIGPTIINDPNSKTPTIMFWSNWDSDTVPTNSSGRYIYSSDSIYKFDENDLESADTSASSIRVLCTARLHWEYLKCSGVYGTDTRVVSTPVVEAVSILLTQQDGMVVDFSAGGGTGGASFRHNHSNNAQSGFAYGVVAPGTTLQPINWS